MGILALCSACFIYGAFAHRNKLFPYPALSRLVYWSTWHRIAPERSWGAARTPDTPRIDDGLTALPYISGYEPAPEDRGVVLYDAERSHPGLNLFTSGHDTSAYLIDMQGNTVHEWSLGPIKAWDEHAPPASAKLIYPEWGYWRRAHAYPNGDLLVIYESAGLLRINAESKVVWSFWGGCHHDLFVAPSGDIYVLGKEWANSSSLDRNDRVINDRIFVLSPDGQVKKSISLLSALENSPHVPLLDFAEPHEPDIFHSNTVYVFDGSLGRHHPAFRSGNILTSIRSLNTLVIIDPDLERVVWTITGPWRWQHDPLPLSNGNVLLFNNKYASNRSQVLEFSPLTHAIEWSYEDSEFHSNILGTIQRLENQNTLVTESTHGRAFELTPELQIVWEFHNPHRSGDDGELIATLFDMVRYEHNYFTFLP